jgi:hypothetical protein
MRNFIAPLLVVLAAAAGCTRADYVPDGALDRPLTQFDRIDIRPLVLKLPPVQDIETVVSPERFLPFFRKDLLSRLLRRNVLSLSNGNLLVLQGSLTSYRCESRQPTHQRDNLLHKAKVEVDILLTDETGKRIGGGRSSIEYTGQTLDGAMSGAEVRVVRAIAAYLRKASKGQGPDVPDEP